MKLTTKRILLLLVCIGAFAAFAGRTVYVARHGQVGDRDFTSPVYKNGGQETALTPLGKEQAHLLGVYMHDKKGFQGKIYASPLYRTLQTATLIAEPNGMKIIAEPGVQEYAPIPKKAKHLQNNGEYGIVNFGVDAEELVKYFPNAVAGPRFAYPWRYVNESDANRRIRIAKCLDAVLAETKGDVMFVGHGASVGGLCNIMVSRMAEKPKKVGTTWNCCLHVFTLDDNDKIINYSYETFEYLPKEKVTSNFRCPLIERPDDPKYMTKAQDKANRAKRREGSKKKTN